MSSRAWHSAEAPRAMEEVRVLNVAIQQANEVTKRVRSQSTYAACRLVNWLGKVDVDYSPIDIGTKGMRTRSWTHVTRRWEDHGQGYKLRKVFNGGSVDHELM